MHTHLEESVLRGVQKDPTDIYYLGYKNRATEPARHHRMQ